VLSTCRQKEPEQDTIYLQKQAKIKDPDNHGIIINPAKDRMTDK
jgi:hypothetical protein